MTSTGEQVVLSPEDVLHIPGLGFDGIMGYSPIALEKNAIGLGIASEELYVGMRHPYHFVMGSEQSSRLIGEYDYEWTDAKI